MYKLITAIGQLRLIGLIYLTLLALYCLNPFDMGYLFGLLFVPALVANQDFLHRNIDSTLFILALFSTVYALFYSLQADELAGKQFIFIYWLTPPCFYLIGKYFSGKIDKDRNLVLFLITVFTVYSLPAVISVYTVFLEGGFGEAKRNLPWFWDGKMVSATIMGAYLTFNMCIPAILISRNFRYNLFLTLASIALFALSLVCVIRLGSRTQLAIFLITSVLASVYIIPRQSFRKNLLLLLVLGGVVYYISTNLSFNLNEDWLTNFAGRMGGSDGDITSGGGRTERWSKSIANLFRKPLGWDLREIGYAHNLWLDVARSSGIITFGLLVLFTIRSFVLMKKVLIKGSEIHFKSVMLIYFIAFLLIFMVEPIFEGIFSLFVLFCFFTGIMKAHLNRISQ